jgi:tetratricopeptide (TPR) repeat protein
MNHEHDNMDLERGNVNSERDYQRWINQVFGRHQDWTPDCPPLLALVERRLSVEQQQHAAACKYCLRMQEIQQRVAAERLGWLRGFLEALQRVPRRFATELRRMSQSAFPIKAPTGEPSSAPVANGVVGKTPTPPPQVARVVPSHEPRRKVLVPALGLGGAFAVGIICGTHFPRVTPATQIVLQQDRSRSQISIQIQAELAPVDANVTFGLGATPSSLARKLAQQVPPAASAYDRAVRDIAEGQPETAIRRLNKEKVKAEADLVEIARATAQAEYYAGHWSDAVRSYQQALALRPEDPALMNEAAVVIAYAGDYPEAERLFRRALHLYSKSAGGSTREDALATVRNNLAYLYYDWGRSGEAEALYEQVRAVRERRDPDGLPLAETYRNLGLLYRDLGRQQEAEAFLNKEKEILERSSLPEEKKKVELARNLANLALVYRSQKRYTEAEKLYLQALPGLSVGGDSIAWAHNGLGIACLETGRYAKAEEYFNRAEAEFKEAVGTEDHPYVAWVLTNKAHLLYRQQRYEEAESLLRRVITIWTAKLGPTHPDVIQSLRNYATLLRKMHRDEDAEKQEGLARSLAARSEKSGKRRPVYNVEGSNTWEQ